MPPPLTTLSSASQLLLASIAGSTAAVGITVARWILLETGEVVLLLFATDTNAGVGGDDCDIGEACQEPSEHERQNAATLFDGTDLYNASSNSNTFGTCSSTFESNNHDQYSTTSSASSSSSFTAVTVGETLRAIGTSPILRSTSLLLLFLSSTTLLLGVILLHDKVRKARHYGEECMRQLLATALTMGGVSDVEELTTRIMEKRMQFTNALRAQFVTTVKYTEGMVLDNVLRTAVKNGIEFSMGIMGGAVLYSLPLEELFGEDDDGNNNNDEEEEEEGNTAKKKNAKNARRRLIRAAAGDPYLERILFRKGGIWDVIPPRVKECCMTLMCDDSGGESMRTKAIMQATSEASSKLSVHHGDGDGSASSTEIALVHASSSSSLTEPTILDEDDSNDNNDEEGSENTPLLASPTREFDTRDDTMHGVDDGDDVTVRCGDGRVVVVRANGVGKKAVAERRRMNEDDTSSSSPCETVADALHGTIRDLLVSNFIHGKTKPSAIMNHDTKSEGSQSTTTEELQHQHNQQQQLQQHPVSPPPTIQLIEKMLHRASMTAAFLFLCHLRGSPSARKSWNSAAHFIASLGLISAALGTGVASAALHNNSNALGMVVTSMAMAGHHRHYPIAGVVCAKVLEGLHTNVSLPQPMRAWMMMLSSKDWGSGIQHLLDRFRREIRRNKRLQAALAFVVLSGVGRMSRRDGGGVRRGIR